MCYVQSCTHQPRNKHLTSVRSQHGTAKPSSSVSNVVASFRPRPFTGRGAGGSEEEAVGKGRRMDDGGNGMGMRMRCGRQMYSEESSLSIGRDLKYGVTVVSHQMASADSPGSRWASRHLRPPTDGLWRPSWPPDTYKPRSLEASTRASSGHIKHSTASGGRAGPPGPLDTSAHPGRSLEAIRGRAGPQDTSVNCSLVSGNLYESHKASM